MTTIYHSQPERKARGPEDQPIYHFHFPEGSRSPSGVYRVFGALAWPDEQAGAPGLALVAGWDKKAKLLRIWAEHEYQIIDPLVKGDEIQVPSCLADFLDKAVADYGCEQYAWTGADWMFDGYVRQVADSPHIRSKPMLQLLDWLDPKLAVINAVSWARSQRLRYLEGGPVWRGIQQFESSPELNAGVLALACLVSSVEDSGAQKPRERVRLPAARQTGWEGYT